MTSLSPHSAILLIQCPDQQGIVFAVTGWISRNLGNILYLEQHVDHLDGSFFMRAEWDLRGFRIPEAEIAETFSAEIAIPFRMCWGIHFSHRRPRMALFASRLSHCLYDLLSRCTSAEWAVDVPLIISNHGQLESVARRFDIPFHHLPVSAATRRPVEAAQLELLAGARVDFVVLARYMQILSPEFIARYPMRIINIHHSFLPAFPGARPYHSASERGVKIIGATSHYVTAELDSGPIIEQDVVKVSHLDSVDDFVRKGRDLEKIVLARAVRNHFMRKVLVHNNRTVVFS